MKKKVGVFGGSFDPIHFGHIRLALQLFEIHHLHEVLFCPVFCSPFKLNAPPVASPSDRLHMLQLALEDIPHFKVTSLEIERKGPSFAIDTLKALQSDGVELHLLLSEEVASHLNLWKQSEELIRLAPPLIGCRFPKQFSLNPLSSLIKRGITQTQIFEVSSSEIRKRLKENLFCGHLVPSKVLSYIIEKRIY
jgi:nicotinate-nucleotide adenylyltransferase